jgi:micrococcal nuclease
MFNYLTRKYYERRFNKLDVENINFFSFEGLKTYCFVSSVYDGDTVTVIFYHKREPIKYKVRLYGIDTPEIRTRDKKEKELGYKARDFLREIILEKTVLVEFMKYDKYGRILGVFYDKNNNNINQIMIDNGHAKEYFGGTK